MMAYLFVTAGARPDGNPAAPFLNEPAAGLGRKIPDMSASVELPVSAFLEGMYDHGVEKVVIAHANFVDSCGVMGDAVKGALQGIDAVDSRAVNVLLPGDENPHVDPKLIQFHQKGLTSFCRGDKQALQRIREQLALPGVNVSTFAWAEEGAVWREFLHSHSGRDIAVVNPFELLYEPKERPDGKFNLQAPWDERLELEPHEGRPTFRGGSFVELQKSAPTVFMTHDALWDIGLFEDHDAIFLHYGKKGYIVVHTGAISFLAPPLHGVVQYFRELKKKHGNRFAMRWPTKEAVEDFFRENPKGKRMDAQGKLMVGLGLAFSMAALVGGAWVCIRVRKKPIAEPPIRQQKARPVRQPRGETRPKESKRLNEESSKAQSNQDGDSLAALTKSGAGNVDREQPPSPLFSSLKQQPDAVYELMKGMLESSGKEMVKVLSFTIDGKTAAQTAITQGCACAAAAMMCAVADNGVRKPALGKLHLKALQVSLPELRTVLSHEPTSDSLKWLKKLTEVERQIGLMTSTQPAFNDNLGLQPLQRGRDAPERPSWVDQKGPYESSLPAITHSPKSVRKFSEITQLANHLVPKKAEKRGRDIYIPNSSAVPHVHVGPNHVTFKNLKGNHLALLKGGLFSAENFKAARQYLRRDDVQNAVALEEFLLSMMNDPTGPERPVA